MDFTPEIINWQKVLVDGGDSLSNPVIDGGACDGILTTPIIDGGITLSYAAFGLDDILIATKKININLEHFHRNIARMMAEISQWQQ